MGTDTNPTALIDEAIRLLRDRAKAATEWEDERWMVDQSPDSGLIVGNYTPGDVGEDGVVSTCCVAYFAYPDDQDRRAHGQALPVATHMAALDPVVARALADLLEEAAHYTRLPTWRKYPLAVRAVALARAYLRRDDG